MDAFNTSCLDALSYPHNLICPGTYKFYLKGYSEGLDKNGDRLFNEGPAAAVHLWEFEENAKGRRGPFTVRLATDQLAEFAVEEAKTADRMRALLRMPGRKRDLKDPMCRFVFVHADHSRAPLNTTREMLMAAFTYHQVMPAYLDFVFPFGEQEYPTDFYFTGFRYENSLNVMDQKLAIPELGRSGKGYQLCYGLKSVERSGDRRTPWSVRQTAAYHSFDVETGRTTWIMIKGNLYMKERIEQAAGKDGQPILKSFNSRVGAFSAALATHLIVCEWAGENWRWYVNFLEGELRGKTGDALRATVSRPTSPDNLGPPTRSGSVPPPRRQRLMPTAGHYFNRVFSFHHQPTPTPPLPTANPPPQRQSPSLPPAEQQEFSFSDLQDTQGIEEKTNEVSLVLEMNVNVLFEMKSYYLSLLDSDDFPEELKTECRGTMMHFANRVKGVINDLEIQRSRLQALLKLLSDRKALLYAILEYKSLLANKSLTQKSQVSADKMEKMTDQMRRIAKKTEKETVSMRIVTLVTLVFLPGTFISTLMSTDIIRFPFSDSSGGHQRNFSSQALWLYLAITLPLMAGTFFAAWGFWRWYRVRDGWKEGDDGGWEADGEGERV